MALPRADGRASLALVGSGVRIPRLSDEPTTFRSDFRSEDWQKVALNMYDALGVLRQSAQFYSRMLSRIRIYPALQGPDGKAEPITSGLPVEMLNRIQDPSGGKSQILSNYGRLSFITGEGVLFGHFPQGDRERWQYLWKEELRFNDRGEVTHLLSPSGAGKDYTQLADRDWDELAPGEAVAYRFWTPHPRFSQWPDSPMRSILEDAAELLILNRSVKATATSRLVKSPIMFLPQEVSPGPVEPTGDEDPLNDPIMADLAAHLETALRDPSAAAALAPYVMWLASEYIEKIRIEWMHRSEDDYLERDLRKEKLESLAVSLDFPPEELLGMSQANHWSAWQISEDKWLSHGAPRAEQFCSDLAESYLRPGLRDEDYPGWQNVIVVADASAVVVKPDRFKDALELWKVGGIGYEPLREAGSFTEDQKQSDEDHESWMEWLRKGQEETDDQGNGPPSDAGPPPGEPGPQSEKTNLPSEESLRIMGAAELALLRCRELAGSRIRSRRDSCPECLEAVKDVPHQQVIAALGEQGLSELGNPEPIDLVATGADVLRHLLMNWGYPHKEADRLGGLVELHASRTLFHLTPPPVPQSLARTNGGR